MLNTKKKSGKEIGVTSKLTRAKGCYGDIPGLLFSRRNFCFFSDLRRLDRHALKFTDLLEKNGYLTSAAFSLAINVAWSFIPISIKAKFNFLLLVCDEVLK